MSYKDKSWAESLIGVTVCFASVSSCIHTQVILEPYGDISAVAYQWWQITVVIALYAWSMIGLTPLYNLAVKGQLIEGLKVSA